MSDVIKNKILKNKRSIFDTEAVVQFNVAQIQVARSVIEENITDAQQSYLINAAGNRELIMRTTDDVFRNRLMMIELLQPTNNDQEAFQLSMANRVKVEYLEHRSKMNRKMVAINQKMADAIKALGDVTQTFFELNEEMVNYIDEIADSNGQWLDGELEQMMESASGHGNESRVVEIEEVVSSIKNSSAETKKIINESFATGDTLKERLNNLQDEGNEMRDSVISLREKVDANQKRVADHIGH
jgi:gas vesicle protein